MRTLRADSTEYLNVTVTTDRDITADLVQAQFVTGGVPAGWQALEIMSSTEVVGASSWTVECRILLGPGGLALPPGYYTVYVRVADSPEAPILPAAGAVRVTAAPEES